MNIFNLGVKICFVKHGLDAMMESAPVSTCSAFSFSVILKPKSLVYSVFSSITTTQLLLALQ